MINGKIRAKVPLARAIRVNRWIMLGNSPIMTTSDVLEDLPISDWTGPFSDQDRQRAIDALEAGRVVVLPRLEFRLDGSETGFLDPAIAAGDRKNISLDPGAGACDAAALGPAEAERLATMMRRFAESARALVEGLAPAYAGHLEAARTSFRPVEIAGRDYSPRHRRPAARGRLFRPGPCAGGGSLRVFSNIACDGAKGDWLAGELFAAFAQRFAPTARLGLPGSGFVLQGLGLTKGRRSAYDEIMLSLHDQAKLDEAYQAEVMPKTAIAFPAHAYLALLHRPGPPRGALRGHSALEQTFHLPVEALAWPERSPSGC